MVPALQLRIAQLLVQARDMGLEIHQRFGLGHELILDVLSHHLSLEVDLCDLLVQVGGILETLFQIRDLVLDLLSPLLLILELAFQCPYPLLWVLEEFLLVELGEFDHVDLKAIGLGVDL